jgi:hypothetical protein
MERLTIPDVRVDEHTTRRSVIDVLAVREHAMEFYFRLKAYEDMVDLETLNNTPISRLAELAEADRDGRVVVKPCKVGDKLYRVFAGEIFEHRVGSMKYFAIQGRWDIETYPFCPCVESSIGKTIFLTHKEAEKALREIQGKEDADGATDKPE